MIPDDMEITSSDDEDPIGTLPAPNMAHGEWQSIGNIQSYLACPNNRCYKKKLNDNICPNCQSDYTSNDKGVVALIATAGLKLPDCKDLKTVKMFTDILRQTYSQLKPGLPFPTDVANLEDELFDELPKNCSFKINANNVLTHINLL